VRGRQPIYLTRYHRRWIYWLGGALLLTGVAWLVFHNFVTVVGELGEERHPSEVWWLRLHGAAAMAFLVLVGTLIPGHVAGALRSGRNLSSGVPLLTLLAALALTGYGLYYAGGEETRSYISVCHWVVGLAAAFGFFQHRRWFGWFAHKSPRRRIETAHERVISSLNDTEEL
jgi:hypothetical protein